MNDNESVPKPMPQQRGDEGLVAARNGQETAQQEEPQGGCRPCWSRCRASLHASHTRPLRAALHPPLSLVPVPFPSSLPPCVPLYTPIAARLRDGDTHRVSSFPHGRNGFVACVFGTSALIFSIAAVNDCHFLKSKYTYCHPLPEPKPAYGSCGDCHCIKANPDDACPSDPDQIPLTEMSDDWLRQLKRMKVLNPIEMACNPYKTSNRSCTDPPQQQYQVELWETAACGVKYNMDTLDDDQCPTEYALRTYDTKADMVADGAVLTHHGACGACSTTQDLAVYVEYPDLTGKGQECAIRGMANATDGPACFMEVGYTKPCADAWNYNVLNTRDHCFDICIDFTFLGDGSNNGPPPECRIANCLLCDEQMSGPVFQTEAARSRRRSGLLSKIVRDCSNLLIVPHRPPCDVTREAIANGARYRTRQLQVSVESPVRPIAPEKWRPPTPKETCVFIEEDLGISGYASTEASNWLVPGFLQSQQEQIYTSVYSTCFRYDFESVVSGFWKSQDDIFGPTYQTARAFAILAIVIGVVCLLCMWTSSCLAYHHTFWKTYMAGCLAVCGLSMFLTMVFFASGVCELGCEFGQSAAFAVVAGILWWIASYFSFRTAPFDPTQPRARTCCCPEKIEDTGVVISASSTTNYAPVPTTEIPARIDVAVTETIQADGSTVVEKVTTYPNGSKSVEVTTTRKREPPNDA